MIIERYHPSNDPEDVQHDCYDCGARIDSVGLRITFTDEAPIYLDLDCGNELYMKLQDQYE